MKGRAAPVRSRPGRGRVDIQRDFLRMHDVLRQRLIRRIESLPEEQVYHVLDYIEFLESKYARNLNTEASGLQKFAENLQDGLRKKAMNPETLREAFQLIAAADRVLAGVSSAGRKIISELGVTGNAEGDRARNEKLDEPPAHDDDEPASSGGKEPGKPSGS